MQFIKSIKFSLKCGEFFIMFTNMIIKKLPSKLTALFRISLYTIFALIMLCLLVDKGVSFYVRDKIFTNIDELPSRAYALVLGTSKYIVGGKPNAYYEYRLAAAKELIDHQKVNYLLLSGDNRTVQYNEPRAMFRDLRKMGISETSMFRDFAGFRTLDSVIRADKIFQVQAFTIVSQKFHCERALLIAKAHDIDAICFVAKQPELHLSTRIREVFARIKAVLDLILGVEPYFLGDPTPLPNSTKL